MIFILIAIFMFVKSFECESVCVSVRIPEEGDSSCKSNRWNVGHMLLSSLAYLIATFKEKNKKKTN